jgi:hypothetical protein
LFGTLLLVKGREDISELETGYQVAIGLALLAAAVAAVVATVQAAYAAQGTPQSVANLTGEGLSSWELDQARDAKNKLKCSRKACLVAVAFLVGAIALTWFGEAAEAEPSQARLLVIDKREVWSAEHPRRARAARSSSSPRPRRAPPWPFGPRTSRRRRPSAPVLKQRIVNYPANFPERRGSDADPSVA